MTKKQKTYNDIFNNTVRQISFSKGGPIIQCINDIIVQSSYLEDALKTIYVSSLTPDMLDAGIKAIDKEIEEYKDENKKHVILKGTSEDLNKRFCPLWFKIQNRNKSRISAQKVE